MYPCSSSQEPLGRVRNMQLQPSKFFSREQTNFQLILGRCLRKCVNKAVWSRTYEATSPSPNLGGSKGKQVVLVTVTLPETRTHPQQADTEKLGCIQWAFQKQFPHHGKSNKNPKALALSTGWDIRFACRDQETDCNKLFITNQRRTYS